MRRDKPLKDRRIRKVRKALTARFPGLRERLIEGTARHLSAAIRRRVDRVDWTVEGLDETAEAIHRGPVVIALWHEAFLIAPFFALDLPRRVISLHDPSPAGRIGRIHARSIGLDAISTGADGPSQRTVLRRVRDGVPAALALDGPSGPSRIAKPAALDWARTAGAEVVLFAAATDRGRRLPSWDGMIWPSGARGLAAFAPGPPVGRGGHARGADAREAARRALEDALIRHSDDVQRRAGMAPGP